MRGIYLQYGKNASNDIDIQINNLNELVLDYCVDNVYTNLLQYFEYINDITKEQPVLDNPETTHIKGSKSLMPNLFLKMIFMKFNSNIKILILLKLKLKSQPVRIKYQLKN